MRSTRFRPLALVLALMLVLAACGSSDDNASDDTEAGPSGDEQYTIGMANFTLCCAYFIGMSDAVQAAATDHGGVTVRVTDANGDAAKLASDIEDLIAQGVDGVIISGGPLEASAPALESLDGAGIPVVMVDRLLAGGPYTSWLGPDNEAIGVQSGEYIVDRLGGTGKLVVIKGGPADNTIGLNRTNGVLSVVSQSDIEVVEAPDFAGWSEDGGLSMMEDLLAIHSDISAVFCENDSMCLGAQNAIADAGRSEEIFLVGVDGQKEALKAILDGTNYSASSKNDADEIGTAGFDRLMEILGGADVEQDTVIPSPLITVDNAEEYYNPDSVF